MQKVLENLFELLKEKNRTLATAESCTGGMIGSFLTTLPGISKYYGYGVVTYANEAKEKLLGVSHDTLEAYGAVSEETAREMAQGALEMSGADISVAVTGIAGPGGGSREKPVGLVYIGIASGNVVDVYKNIFPGSRDEVRIAAAKTALTLVSDTLKKGE